MIIINSILIFMLYNFIFGNYKSNILYCGMVGFSGSPDKKLNEDKIKLLLFANQDRGRDSIGYYTKESGIIKYLGKAEDVISKKDFNIPESNLFIGHLRAATVGSVNTNNAHPFQYGNIVLAMNGTLSNHWDLCRMYKFTFKDFDVDSQVLAAMLNNDQNKEPLTMIIGGCATIYTNTNTNTLYCYRNSDRPLFRGVIDGCMYISSLETPLKMIGCENVKEFKQDILYEIKDGKVLTNIKIKRATIEVSNNINVVTKTINYYNTKSEDLIGLFLEPRRDFYINGLSFKKGYMYEVIDNIKNNHYEIGVLNNNSYVIVSKYMFSEHLPIISIGDHVFGLIDLFYTDTKLPVGKQGDLYHVKSLKNGWYYCKNLSNNKEVSVTNQHVRYATKLEVDEYMLKTGLFSACNVDNNSCKNLNKDNEAIVLTLPKTEEVIFNEQIKETEYDSYEDLVSFTLGEIQDLATDIEELTINTDTLVKVNNIKTLIDNYMLKCNDFLEEEVKNA